MTTETIEAIKQECQAVLEAEDSETAIQRLIERLEYELDASYFNVRHIG